MTDRYQTTAPKMVRRVLKLGKRDKINHTIRPNGDVVLSRVDPNVASDPPLGHFLKFLAKDIARNPELLQPLGVGLQARIQAIVGDVEVDLGAPLPPEDE